MNLFLLTFYLICVSLSHRITVPRRRNRVRLSFRLCASGGPARRTCTTAATNPWPTPTAASLCRPSSPSRYTQMKLNQDARSPVEEEIVAGRVLVHDPTRYLSGSGSSDDGSLNNDDLFASSLPAKPDMNRSLGFTDVEDVVWSDSEPHPHDGPPPNPAEEGKLLQAQKSFDSNASCPDTAGNYSDEFGSTSQVTVLQPHSSARQSGGGGTTSSDDKGSTSFVVTCDSDLDPPHPPTPPP